MGSRRADDIFQEFFGFDGANSGNRSGRTTGFNEIRDPNDIFGGAFDGFAVGASGSGSRKAPAIETQLMCSLEELYKGSTRKIQITRTVRNTFGKTRTVEEILTIDIKPGWKKGTKITFHEKGNQEPGIIAADLIFVVGEKTHAFYHRDGNDLVVTKKISHLEALTGTTIDLTTLDGRSLTIPLTQVIRPGHEVVIPNEGMPISKQPGKKGNLRIKFFVMFPSRLTPEQKSELKRVLGSSG